MPLPIRSLMSLQLAATSYKFPAARETDAHHLVGMSAPVFWRHVNLLLDDPRALEAMPVEVNRLRRVRDQRRQRRAS